MIMQKFFKQTAFFLLVLWSAGMLPGCFQDDEKESTNTAPPAYLSQAHVLVINSQNSGGNITSVTINGTEQLSTPLIPDFYLHSTNDTAATGIDVALTDYNNATIFITNQDIALGQALYIEFNGPGNWYYEVGNYADYLSIVGTKAKNLDVHSTGKSIQKLSGF